MNVRRDLTGIVKKGGIRKDLITKWITYPEIIWPGFKVYIQFMQIGFLFLFYNMFPILFLDIRYENKKDKSFNWIRMFLNLNFILLRKPLIDVKDVRNLYFLPQLGIN